MKTLQKNFSAIAGLLFLAVNAQATMFFARPYDPNLQRWLTRDPMGEQPPTISLTLDSDPVADVSVGEFAPREPMRVTLMLGNYQEQANLYAYVGNDPVNYVDPWGLWMWFWQRSVRVEGGTPADRTAVRQDLNQIYQTDRGNTLRRVIRREGTQRCIHLNSMGRNGVPIANPADIYIDPSSHPVIQTTAGPQPASTIRIVAHELGHSATGTADDGPNRMNNVNQNENPIVTRLRVPQPARTRY